MDFHTRSSEPSLHIRGIGRPQKAPPTSPRVPEWERPNDDESAAPMQKERASPSGEAASMSQNAASPAPAASPVNVPPEPAGTFPTTHQLVLQQRDWASKLDRHLVSNSLPELGTSPTRSRSMIAPLFPASPSRRSSRTRRERRSTPAAGSPPRGSPPPPALGSPIGSPIGSPMGSPPRTAPRTAQSRTAQSRIAQSRAAPRIASSLLHPPPTPSASIPRIREHTSTAPTRTRKSCCALP